MIRTPTVWQGGCIVHCQGRAPKDRQGVHLKAVSLPLPLQLSSGVLMTPLIAAWAAAFCFFSNSMVFLNSFSSES